MKRFINKVFTLLLFILSLGCAYIALIIPFASSFVNIILLLIAVFLLLQACGNIDKENGFGEYNRNKPYHFNEHHPDENIDDDDTANDDDISDSTEEEDNDTDE